MAIQTCLPLMRMVITTALGQVSIDRHTEDHDLAFDHIDAGGLVSM